MQNKLTALWAIMSLVLIVELIAVLWAVWVNFLQIFELLKIQQEAAAVLPLQVGIVLLLAVSALWLLLTLRGSIQKKDWVRSSNLTIQVLVLAASTGILQGIMSTKPVGFTLLACAIFGALTSMLIAGFKREADLNEKPN